MKVTIDLRHVAVAVSCIAFGFGVHAFAAQPVYTQPPPPPPADPSYPVSTPVPGVTRWEFKCVDHESAGVPQNWANHDLDKPDGWNPYLSKMANVGWEPVTFIAPQGVIMTVCFRRAAAPKVSAPAPAPSNVPAAGRCSGAQIAEMRASGMSESAINSACKQP